VTKRTLIAQPLTAEAFKPFGQVIEVADYQQHFGINHGFTERYHDLAKLELTQEFGQPIVSIFRSSPKGLPLKIELMERHPLSSQAFMPLSGKSYLVVVAPAGEFNPDNLAAFVVSAEQGVNYATGVWHHFCLALEQTCDFLVIDRKGPGNNCDEIELDGNIVVEL